MTFDEVVRMALELPGVEQGPSYGTPGLKVRGKFLARLREEDVLVIRLVDVIEQEMLTETQPDIFFITDHYRGYPAVLIRLSRIEPAQLAELFENAWRKLAPRKLLALR